MKEDARSKIQLGSTHLWQMTSFLTYRFSEI